MRELTLGALRLPVAGAAFTLARGGPGLPVAETSRLARPRPLYPALA
jgi:hypothetical protein